MLQYQQVMQQFLETERSVMLGYLGAARQEPGQPAGGARLSPRAALAPSAASQPDAAARRYPRRHGLPAPLRPPRRPGPAAAPAAAAPCPGPVTATAAPAPAAAPAAVPDPRRPRRPR